MKIFLYCLASAREGYLSIDDDDKNIKIPVLFIWSDHKKTLRALSKKKKKHKEEEEEDFTGRRRQVK